MILEETNSIALIACFLTTNQQQRYLQFIFRKIFCVESQLYSATSYNMARSLILAKDS